MIDLNNISTIKNGTPISIQSIKTKTYISIKNSDKEYIFSITGLHPFLENNQIKNNTFQETKFYIYSFNFPDKSNLELRYGDAICIMTSCNQFICSANNGYLVLEKERLVNNYVNIDDNLNVMSYNDNIINNNKSKKLSSATFPPNSKFFIYDGLNTDNLESVISYGDEIVLKSNFDYYLMIDSYENNYNRSSDSYDKGSTQYEVICNGSLIGEESLFKFINPNVPYVPNWINRRKFINYNYTSVIHNEIEKRELEKVSKQRSVLGNNIFNYNNGNNKMKLLNKSKDEQESHLLEDLLLNLIGFDGDYIKRKLEIKEKDNLNNSNNVINNSDLKSEVNKSNSKINEYDINIDVVDKEELELNEKFKKFSNKFKIEPYLSNFTCDTSLAFIINRILPLSYYYDKICSFINYSYSNETGVVCKAFSNALSIKLKDYILMINEIESDYFYNNSNKSSNNNVDIQRLWYLCQKPLKILESLKILTSKCMFLKGGHLINEIYNFYKKTSDIELQELFQTLLEKAFCPYMLLLKNWVCYGELDDCFNEFMVYSNIDFTYEYLGEYYNELYWNKKYNLNDLNTPIFLKNIANQILFIGKSIVLLKESNIIVNCPFNEDFEHYIIYNNRSNNNNFLKKKDESIKFLSIIDNIDNLNKFCGFIQKIYNWTNSKLLSIIFKENNILNILKSIKKMFLLECGDFYSYFLDLSDEYLNQSKSNIEEEKIKNLFFTAQNSTSLINDQYKMYFEFKFSSLTLDKEKQYYDNYVKIIEDNNDIIDIKHHINELNKTYYNDINENNNNIDHYDVKVIDCLTLEMNIQDNLLLNIIFNKKTLMKYKLLFRQLISLKYQEKKLGETWIYQHSFTNINTKSEYNDVVNYLKSSYLLRSKMINFIKNLSSYFFYEIIQSNYIKFINEINLHSQLNLNIKNQKVKELLQNTNTNTNNTENNFLDFLNSHNLFLDSCMSKSFLFDSNILSNTSTIIHTCMTFSNMINKFYKNVIEDNMLVANDSVINKYNNDLNYKKISDIFKNSKVMNTVKLLEDTFEERLEVFLDKIISLSSRNEVHLNKLILKLDYNNFYYDKFLEKKIYNNNNYKSNI